MNAKYGQNQVTPTIIISMLPTLCHQVDTIFSLADQELYLSNQYNGKNQNQNDTTGTKAFQKLSGTLASIISKSNLPTQHYYAYPLHHECHELYDA